MKRALVFLIAVVVSLIVLQKGAFVSQIHPQDKTLDDVVANSTYVLVVEKLQPPLRYESVATYNGVKFKKPVKIPVYRFKVLEKIYSIYAKDIMPLVGIEMCVYGANSDTALEVQATYEKDGTMKSPFNSEYSSSINFDKEKKMIIFVRRGGDFKLKFVADGAYEPVAKRKDIEDICKKEKAKRSGYELIDEFKKQ